MSGEIVVGACYRALGDDMTMRVIAHDGDVVMWVDVSDPTQVVQVPEWRWRSYYAQRVPDPTPAVIDDAVPPLAGEMTLRQVEAWRVRRGIDDLSLLYATRTGLWHAHAERDGTVIGHGTSSDPQDAITALMARVGP